MEKTPMERAARHPAKPTYLGQNSSKVCSPGSVPEKHSVSILLEWFVLGLFTVATDLENLFEKRNGVK